MIKNKTNRLELKQRWNTRLSYLKENRKFYLFKLSACASDDKLDMTSVACRCVTLGFSRAKCTL